MIARGLPLVPDGAMLVANGKQALSLVAQDLRARGVLTLLAPDHYCLTMIQPFQLEGIRIRHVATDEQALMDVRALGEALADGSHHAVLHCEVYGARATPALLGVLDAARSSGVPVVADATHSLFASTHDPADYLVASLRKLLPLPEGAFVSGPVSAPTQARHAIDDEAARLGLLAARCRHDFLAGTGSQDAFIAAVDAFEDAVLEAREPVDISPIALRMLEELDADALLAARRGNAQYVLRRLLASGLEVLNPRSPECGVVVRVDDADATERDLLAEGIICPISWPRPEGLAHDVAWRTDIVTLPVDPGAHSEELDRAASVVERHRPPSRA